MNKLKNIIISKFKPEYNEFSLFLMSITTILILLTSGIISNIFSKRISSDYHLIYYIVSALFILYGLLLPIYHSFTERKKTKSEKIAMMVFAVLAQSICGIYASGYIIENSQGLLIIFPLWNLINSVLIIMLVRYEFINEEIIIDDNVTASEVIIGLVSVSILFCLSKYIFNQYWAVTYSICLVYSLNAKKMVVVINNLYKRKI